MKILKYLVSLVSLFFGFIIVTLKDVYQNTILTLFCSELYKFGPNNGCDAVLGMPDFGFLFLIFGILGLLFSAYADLVSRGKW